MEPGHAQYSDLKYISMQGVGVSASQFNLHLIINKHFQ